MHIPLAAKTPSNYHLTPLKIKTCFSYASMKSCPRNFSTVYRSSNPLKEDIVRYIDQNLRQASLVALAKIYFYSPQYLSLLIRKSTNSTFKEIYLERQLQRGKNLLETTNLSVELITNTIGYQNVSSFCQIFKKFYGLTPKAYRLAYRAQKKQEEGILAALKNTQKQ